MTNAIGEIDHDKAEDWGQSMAERYDVAEQVGIATAYDEMGADIDTIAEEIGVEPPTVEELLDEMDTALDRQAQRQGRTLARQHGLRDQVGIAVAYKRLGFSASGVAKRVDVATSTAKGYLDSVADRFGDAALFAYHGPGESDPLASRTVTASDPAPSESERRQRPDNGSQPSDDPLSNVDAINGGDGG